MLPLVLALSLLSPAWADKDDREIKKAAKLAGKKPYSASAVLYPKLTTAQGAQLEDVRYHLARSLVALDLSLAAEPYLAAIVKDGPGSVQFEPAAQLLVEIAEEHGDLEALVPIAASIPREQLPDSVEQPFLYLQGIDAAEKGDLALSRRLLDDVLPPVRPYAKFYQGVVFARQGKLRSASGAFLDVHQASGDGRVDAPQELQDAAMMNVARIYFDVERWDEAKKYYSMVGKKSPYWGQALLEAGWTYFMTDELEPALARVLTVKALEAQKGDDAPPVWIPEATVLECLVYYSASAFEEAEKTLLQFENDGNSLQFEMEELLKNAAHQPQLAWEMALAEPDTSDLPIVLRAILARDQDYQAARSRFHEIKDELLSIKVAPVEWKATVGTPLQRDLQALEKGVVTVGGQRVVARLEEEKVTLNDLLAQSEIIRFEINEARRRELEQRAANPTEGKKHDKPPAP